MATRRHLRPRIGIDMLHKRQASNLSDLFKNYDSRTVPEDVSKIVMEVSNTTSTREIIEPRWYPRKLAGSITPYQQFRKGARLYVTDLSTKYCELKFFYEEAMFKEKTTTYTKEGTQVHKALEVVSDQQLGVVPVPAEIEPEMSDADQLWAKFYHNVARLKAMLENRLSVREIYVFGKISQAYVSGYIDELKYKDQQITVNDTKSRHSSKIPEFRDRLTAYHQVLVYHHLLDTMINSDLEMLEKTVVAMFPNLLDVPLSAVVKETLNVTDNTPRDRLRLMVDILREVKRSCILSNHLQVTYVKRTSADESSVLDTLNYQFDQQTLDELLEFSMGFWLGKREAIGVSIEERNKCRFCAMYPHCEWGHIVKKAADGTN